MILGRPWLETIDALIGYRIGAMTILMDTLLRKFPYLLQLSL